MVQEDAMTRLGVVAIGLALGVATAQAQTLGETSAAMGVTQGLAGTAVQRTAPVTNQVREQLKNSGNPSGSTCPLSILANYGKRVASEQAAKQAPKGAWAAAGELGAKTGGQKTWTASGTQTRGAANSAWAKNDKGTHIAPRRK
jgi:hypothetical protein